MSYKHREASDMKKNLSDNPYNRWNLATDLHEVHKILKHKHDAKNK